ncbi:MAG: DUF2298 domain-containing protein [Methanomicrobiales archaeon]|nr:DUF2298 domain-containing protein [Methanomicrobiales archaeon]
MDGISQAYCVLAWAGLIKLLQMSVWPHLRSTLSQYAYPAAFPFSILLFALGSWYLALLRLPIQLSLLVFIGLAISGIVRGGYSREALRGLAVWDALFLLGFAFALGLRFVNPAISHFSEQFMNHAFLAGIMLNPQIPPLDPWFVGGDLSIYYYLGHFTMGALAIAVSAPSEVAFNLILPTVFGVSFVMLYALGDLILPRHRWLPLAVLFAIPPSVLWFLGSGCGLYGALDRTNWLIAGGRFEFPLFSLFLGNAHAFEIGIFNQLLLLFLLAFAWHRWVDLDLRGRLHLVLLLSLSLGTMPLLNAWDALVYGPLVLGFVLYQRLRARRDAPHSSAWTPALLVPPIALCWYLPCYLHLQPSGIEGIGSGFGPTDPVSFLGVWGFFLLVLYLDCARDMAQSPGYLLSGLPFLFAGYCSLAVALVPLLYLVRRGKHAFSEFLCVAGLSALIFCEIFYFQERLGGDYSRFNTVFKFYFVSWVLLGSGSLLVAGARLSQRRPLFTPAVQRLAAAGAAIALLIAPFALPIDIGRGLLGIQYPSGYHTLDGSAYLEGVHPGDAAAIAYLKGLPGSHRIVEAENGDYTYYSRVSTFTGIPTILGQRAHEFTWRGNPDGWYEERPEDIRAIYEDPHRTIPLMDKYGMTLLYVGDLERERYSVSLPPGGLNRIYDEGGVQIYERER